ncbi:hypothetical protein OIU77_008810 [Salix suchowensis]|uniref:Thioredoxin domain-containing protein n=1 Tax=Salix suchowensis TaxID=1278906 RepID=A0ABQ9AC82_9ROSI|nr:hypothetical protein OIU77_008810 [Salix suchowensis]
MRATVLMIQLLGANVSRNVTRFCQLLSFEEFNLEAKTLSLSLSLYIYIYIYNFCMPQVVVHFTASWCKPSVAMNPFFEEIAMSYKDLLFLCVDVDEVKGVGAKMKIKAMPTFSLMRGGAEVDKLVGANPGETRKRVGGFARTIRRCKSGSLDCG